MEILRRVDLFKIRPETHRFASFKMNRLDTQMLNPRNRLVEVKRQVCVFCASNLQGFKVKELVEIADQDCGE